MVGGAYKMQITKESYGYRDQKWSSTHHPQHRWRSIFALFGNCRYNNPLFVLSILALMLLLQQTLVGVPHPDEPINKQPVILDDDRPAPGAAEEKWVAEPKLDAVPPKEAPPEVAVGKEVAQVDNQKVPPKTPEVSEEESKPSTLEVQQAQHQQAVSENAQEAGTKTTDVETVTEKVRGKFVLLRAIGNDLPPRHKLGQSYENVKFILENEEQLEGLDKIWVLNKLANETEKARIVALLEEHKEEYVDIPFILAEYAKTSIDFESGFTVNDAIRHGCTYTCVNLSPLRQNLLKASFIDHMYRDKNMFVMNNNGARNRMIEEGLKRGYEWVLPFDGNCFLTKTAWGKLRQAFETAEPHTKYMAVPMVRMHDNKDLFDSSFEPQAVEEPQIAFRRGAVERFDETKRYGRRPKVELLIRLGVPGPWDVYVNESVPYYEKTAWNFTISNDVQGRGSVPYVSWVARLFSGNAHQEEQSKESAEERKLARCLGVRMLLDKLDARVALEYHRFDFHTLLAFNESVLAWERQSYLQNMDASPVAPAIKALLTHAKKGLSVTPVGKERVPLTPFWIPAYYYDNEKNQTVDTEWDKPSPLAPYLRNITVLTLAGYLTDDNEYASHAADLVRSLFLEPSTRTTPQDLIWSMYGRNCSKNCPTTPEMKKTWPVGLVDMDGGIHPMRALGDLSTANGAVGLRDFVHVMDALRLLNRTGALSPEETQQLQSFFWEYSTLLEIEGKRYERYEWSAYSARGIWFDAHLAAVASYSGNVPLFLHIAILSQGRVLHQFAHHYNALRAVFPGLMLLHARPLISIEHALFTLEGWYAMGRMAARAGIDLFGYHRTSEPAPAILRSTDYHINTLHLTFPPSTRKLNKIETTRVTNKREQFATQASTNRFRRYIFPLHYMALAAYPEYAGQVPEIPSIPSLYEAPSVYPPSAGVQPFWNLGLMSSVVDKVVSEK